MSAVVIATVAGIVVMVGTAVWAQWLMRRDLQKYMQESRERWSK